MKVYVSEREWQHTRSVTKDLESSGGKVEYTSVWLKQNLNNDVKIFYCHLCRYPILQYQGDVVTLIPGEAPSQLPIIVQCKGKHCGNKYVFHTIVF